MKKSILISVLVLLLGVNTANAIIYQPVTDVADLSGMSVSVGPGGSGIWAGSGVSWVYESSYGIPGAVVRWGAGISSSDARNFNEISYMYCASGDCPILSHAILFWGLQSVTFGGSNIDIAFNLDTFSFLTSNLPHASVSGLGTPLSDNYFQTIQIYPGQNAVYGMPFSVDIYKVIPDAVPEPATIVLLGLGLVGLAGIRRKFKK